jgi:hypothetical protein
MTIDLEKWYGKRPSLRKIVSIPQLLAFMRLQAELRAPENDEAGCILKAVAQLEADINSLEGD